MAEVFEAELAGELGFSRKVALKRMLADAAADRESAQRFVDEARIASKLHHANIVSVLDVGFLDGLPFQVLELIDGINVEQLQQRAGGKLPVEIALILASEIAHGLDHAHTALDEHGYPLGIVHRDVKPSNVLVSWGGDVKLTDFGIAIARDRETRTQAGIVPGTRGFIAPEQRSRGEVDGRTDVFSLGLALHAMITGASPLEDVAVEAALLTGKPLPLDASLPADIRDAIARAVAPSLRDRPTAAQLASALGACLAPRLSRDARGYLRTYLADFQSRPSRAGVLDQLLGLEVIPLDEPDAFGLRTSGAGLRPEPAPRNRRRAWLPLLALPLLGLGAWRLLRDPVPVPVPVPVADAAPVAVAVADAAPVAVPAADAATPPDAASGRSTKPDVRSPPGTGFLLVGGDDSTVGARILIDGHDAGFAPGKLELPRGHHKVELVRKNGTRTAAKPVDITDYSTLTHPARVVF